MRSCKLPPASTAFLGWMLVLTSVPAGCRFAGEAGERQGESSTGLPVSGSTGLPVQGSAGLPVSGSTGQLSIDRSPMTLVLEGSESSLSSLGILAVDRLVSPSLGGRRLSGAMPTGSVLRLESDGRLTFSYSDLFSRHFRGRRQHLISAGDERPPPGEGVEDLQNLPDGHSKPQILRDASRLDVEELAFNESEDILWWTGELVYEFDFAHAIKSFRLTNLDGTRRTTIGDWDWKEARRSVEILASKDGTTWTTVWRSSGDGGRREVGVSLPQSLLGSPTLLLKFRGESSNALFDLFVSAELDAGETSSLLRLETSRSELEFTDAAESSHRAVVFWTADGLLRGASSAADANSEAGSRPRVLESDESVTILLPHDIEIVLGRRAGHGLAQIERLTVASRDLLSGTDGLPTLSIEALAGKPITGVKDWAEYLAARQKNKGRWPRRGDRALEELSLGDADYLGSRVEGSSVVLRQRLRHREKSGELEWVFTPITRTLGGREYRGVGWKVRLTGCESAMRLRVTEPAVARFGDWAFAQRWGDFIETRLDFATPFTVPQGTYFGRIQPFLFTAGASGAVVSFFDAPVAAEASVESGGGRILATFDIPLGVGRVRETPMKLWLTNDTAMPTKWAALDEWTSIYDAVAGHYAEQLDLGMTTPRPTMIWTSPGDEYYERYRGGDVPARRDLWLREFTRQQLPRAARLGIGVIYFQTPWESDAEHHPETYLPGSSGFGSGHAPRRLVISESIGGEAALRELCRRAHELGVKIVLWTNPGHLSNSSPLLSEHPEWIKWRRDGVPETFAYGDVSGTTLRGGWFDYSLQRYRKVLEATGADGILQDSFLSFCMLSDFRAEQPSPELNEAVALQREIWKSGATEVHIEGCGPLGLSHGGYGHEPPIPEDLERIRGREYGLYRHVADTFVEPESYYRALASKGVIGFANLDVFESLTPFDRERIVRANRDYLAVVEKMQRRHLLAEGDTWQGVEWTNTGSGDVVLFTFHSFEYPLSRSSQIEDITAGSTTVASGRFETIAWHTYVVRGASNAGHRKR